MLNRPQLQLRKRLATGFEFVEKCSGWASAGGDLVPQGGPYQWHYELKDPHNKVGLYNPVNPIYKASYDGYNSIKGAHCNQLNQLHLFFSGFWCFPWWKWAKIWQNHGDDLLWWIESAFWPWKDSGVVPRILQMFNGNVDSRNSEIQLEIRAQLRVTLIDS